MSTFIDGAAAPGLAAPERSANDKDAGASGGRVERQTSTSVDAADCATCTALANALRPEPVLALAGIVGALLALLLRAGRRA